MLEKLVGLKADENALFDLILFEVESNYEYFRLNGYDILLLPAEDKKFQIEKILWRNDPTQKHPDHPEYMKKKWWFSINGKSDLIIFKLVRIDLSVKMAAVYSNGNTDLYPVGFMRDPDEPPRPPLTQEEIRLGIQELCGLMQNKIDAELKPKKAM